MTVAQEGFCVDISSPRNPSIALPPLNPRENDCFCSLIIPEDNENNCFNIRSCSCINDTMFAETFTNCKPQSLSNHPEIFHLCFSNLKTEMNNTLIYIFDTLNECINQRYYRDYNESFRIVIGKYNYYDDTSTV